jgi:uncharacterized protein (TIGR02145 family)
VPTDAEWTTLTNYAGGKSVAGGKLKSTRTAPDAHPRWESPNTGATDLYGFAALPGGHCGHGYGAFDYVGYLGFWWSSTSGDDTAGWDRYMHASDEGVERDGDNRRNGFSVRCIRNN